MEYRKSESRNCPKNVEKISDDRYFLRKNIKKEQREGADGQAVDIWTYEEALATGAEYAAWQAVNQAEMLREAEIVDEYTLKLIEEGVL